MSPSQFPTLIADLENLTDFRSVLDSKILRKCADECGINLKTSFKWQYRFLAMPLVLKATKLEGVIEANETLFAYSEKGAKNLVINNLSEA